LETYKRLAIITIKIAGFIDRIAINLTLDIRPGSESHPYLGGVEVVGTEYVPAGGQTGAKPNLKF